MMQKPRIFIGSSTEGLEIARAIQKQCTEFAYIDVWDQNIFELSATTIESLYKIVDSYDFAVFIISPDDELKIRENSLMTVRDNVIFEIGLFIGRIGRERVIIVSSDDDNKLRIPSDLLSVARSKYISNRLEDNISSAVGPVCFDIQQHLRRIDKSNIKNKKLKTGDHYVASICFQCVKNEVKFAIIETSEERFIFPKVRVLYGSDPIRYVKIGAKKEGGIIGRIISEDFKTINYMKEEFEVIQSVDVYIIEATKIGSPQQSSRNPQWYTYQAAVSAITAERDSKTQFELAEVMQWALKKIEKYRKS